MSNEQSETKQKPKKIKQTVLAKYFHDNGYEAIPPHVFYREMFPQGELASYHEDGSYDQTEWKYNGIILHRTNKVKEVVVKNKLGIQCLVHRHTFKKHVVYDDLIAIDRAIEEANNNGEQVYMSPISYLGRNRDEKNERFLYVFTLEIDDLKTEKIQGKRSLRQSGLECALHQWGANNNPRWENGWFLAPTAVTCSGSGIHCHWFLKEPYPLFGGDTLDEVDYDGKTVVTTHNLRRMQWKWFRENFADYVWNDGVSDSTIQREAIGQSFRMVGSLSKDNCLVEAFWISKKRYSIEELFGLRLFGNGHALYEVMGRAYPRENWDITPKRQMDLTKHEKIVPEKLIKAKEQYPEWYERRVVHKQPPRQKGHWHIKPDLYYWYRDLIKDKAHVGCRYFRLYTLAQYGAKCDIPFETVKEDCINIGEIFKGVGEVPLEDWEIEKAYSVYFNYRAFESTIDYVNAKAHLNIQKNKRNYRSQKEHLQSEYVINKLGRKRRNICYDNREITLQEMRENGEITGRPNKQQLVQQWRTEHPDGIKADCIRDTGFDKKTVYKWWDEK